MYEEDKIFIFLEMKKDNLSFSDTSMYEEDKLSVFISGKIKNLSSSYTLVSEKDNGYVYRSTDRSKVGSIETNDMRKTRYFKHLKCHNVPSSHFKVTSVL